MRNWERNLTTWRNTATKGIEFGGRGLEERGDEIVKATENHPVKASTICAGYGGCLLDSDPEQRELAIAGIRSLLKIGAEIGAVGLIMVPIFGAPRIRDLSPYKTTEELETELLVAILKDIAGLCRGGRIYRAGRTPQPL